MLSAAAVFADIARDASAHLRSIIEQAAVGCSADMAAAAKERQRTMEQADEIAAFVKYAPLEALEVVCSVSLAARNT